MELYTWRNKRSAHHQGPHLSQKRQAPTRLRRELLPASGVNQSTKLRPPFAAPAGAPSLSTVNRRLGEGEIRRRSAGSRRSQKKDALPSPSSTRAEGEREVERRENWLRVSDAWRVSYNRRRNCVLVIAVAFLPLPIRRLCLE